jgi:hypothetical protein
VYGNGVPVTLGVSTTRTPPVNLLSAPGERERFVSTTRIELSGRPFAQCCSSVGALTVSMVISTHLPPEVRRTA